MWNSISKFFEGLLAGSIAGYVLGILTAPKSGAELRHDISNNSSELYKQASESLTEVKGKTGEVLKKASTTVQETRDQIASKIEELTQQGTKAISHDDESIQDMAP